MLQLNLCSNWQLSRPGESEVLPAHVPGCVHTDLLAEGKIPDPFFQDNEDSLLWIGQSKWTYSRTFEVSAELCAQERIILRCEGLDTLATIIVNGKLIAKTDNMYRTWEFDVKDTLQVGENTLEITFDSPVSYAQHQSAKRKIPEWHGPKEIDGRAWIRKCPCNFGWDWGPVCTTSGIWRPIYLQAFTTGRLTDIAIQQEHTENAVTLRTTIAVETNSALSTVISVTYAGTKIAEVQAPVTQGVASAEIEVKDPQLWWPNGMGARSLYDVAVDLYDEQGNVLDHQSRRIGLRTLILDRHQDEWGESFQFVVNGVPFFAKGANWIPADTFVTRITPERYATLLGDAAEAHMNMLRVWGGGIYEDDIFYNLCDELGICIWQDFMFACSTYPTFDDAFIKNVRAEANDNIRRLRHHPCLALWCGNNELEQGFVGESWSDTQMSWDDYGKLFDQILPAIVQELDPERSYWPCSPHSPYGDRKEFNNPTCGDAHLWEVWFGRKPFEWYRTCEHRFNSEFGFQSFPEPRTVEGYTAPEDRNVTTYVMEHHQRSGIGNTVIMQYMLDWYRLPHSFDMTLWLSQILHGMAMTYGVEHWRRSMPRGMGTLYWQINDCWPVASWSSIDYHGRWKALQYMAKRFNAPLLISGVEDQQQGTVEIHATSDLLDACDATINWILTDVAGAQMDHGTYQVEVPARANTRIDVLPLQQYLSTSGPRNLMLWLEMVVDGEVVSTNFVTFAKPKHLPLSDPRIYVTVLEHKDGSFLVSLTAAKPALWAWLALPEDARYSDNFFHIRPGRSVQVIVTPACRMSLAEFERQLQVLSLFDTYQVAQSIPQLA